MEYENLENVIKKREIEICKKEKELKDMECFYKSEFERFEREMNIMTSEIGDLRIKLQKSKDDLIRVSQELCVAYAAKDAYHFCISKIFGGEK